MDRRLPGAVRLRDNLGPLPRIKRPASDHVVDADDFALHLGPGLRDYRLSMNQRLKGTISERRNYPFAFHKVPGRFIGVFGLKGTALRRRSSSTQKTCRSPIDQLAEFACTNSENRASRRVS